MASNCKPTSCIQFELRPFKLEISQEAIIVYTRMYMYPRRGWMIESSQICLDVVKTITEIHRDFGKASESLTNIILGMDYQIENMSKNILGPPGWLIILLFE